MEYTDLLFLDENQDGTADVCAIITAVTEAQLTLIRGDFENTVAEMIQEAMTEESNTLYIAHADCLEEAEALKNAILSRCSFQKVHVGVIGPIVGASVGPGTVAAFICGKEVTIEGND